MCRMRIFSTRRSRCGSLRWRPNEATQAGRLIPGLAASCSHLAAPAMVCDRWRCGAGRSRVCLLRPHTQDTGHSLILSSYTPGLGVEASTYHDNEADATVLMLDGLEEVPSDRKISGISVHRSETEPEVASTTLFDATGSPLLVISRDDAGHPLFLTNTPRG
jgi:hypothetical protein